MALTTTYLGHAIEIEPFEWGYLAQILEEGSNARFVAVSSSAFKALEDAFDAIDAGLLKARDGSPPSREGEAG